MILGTNMRRYVGMEAMIASNILSRAGSKHQRESTQLPSWVLQLAMKAADISYCFNTLEVHKAWVTRLLEQQYVQGDDQKARGLQVSVLMDRTKPSNIADGQAAFFNLVVMPTICNLLHLFPGAGGWMDNAINNMSYWHSSKSRRTSSLTSPHGRDLLGRLGGFGPLIAILQQLVQHEVEIPSDQVVALRKELIIFRFALNADIHSQSIIAYARNSSSMFATAADKDELKRRLQSLWGACLDITADHGLSNDISNRVESYFAL